MLRKWMLLRAAKAIFLVLTALAVGLVSSPARAQEASLTGAPLLQALRGGGLVLYVRHGATNWDENDFWQRGSKWDRKTLDDCKQQRNLSTAGRAELREMGAAIAKLGIPWGTVWASPYCRTRETAELAFRKMEVSWDLFYHAAARSKRAEDGEAIVVAVRRMLGTAPALGTNTVLVSHGGNLMNAASVSLGEGETGVFRPGSGGKYTLVARIGPGDWGKL